MRPAQDPRPTRAPRWRKLKPTALVLFSLAPIVGVTAVAGTITDPSHARPCLVEYAKGIRDGPLHMTLGPDGDLYSTEALGDRIIRFDPDTHETAEFALPYHPHPHDIVAGGEGNLWFDGLNDRLGKLDPRTGRVTMYPGISHGSQPHDLIWSHGTVYIAELAAGRLAIFDPKTGKIREGRFGLPPNNQMHGLVALPNGDIWAALSAANAIARFNPRLGRFDKLVAMPIANSGPRSIVYVRSQDALYFSLFAANQIGRYDLGAGKVTLYPTSIRPVSLSVASSVSVRVEKVSFIFPDARERYLWAATLYGELVRLDLRTHKIKRVHCGITEPAATLGLANDREGRLWVNEPFPSRIARVEP